MVVMLVILGGVAGAMVIGRVNARRAAAAIAVAPAQPAVVPAPAAVVPTPAAVPIAAAPPPAEPSRAHISVIARGGAPRILVDGKPTGTNAPAVIEVAPGKHTVAVRGAPGNQFEPPEYSLDLAPRDTQQVVFVSPRAGQNNEARRKRLLEAADSIRKAKRPRG
jgi:hypothetical protein